MSGSPHWRPSAALHRLRGKILRHEGEQLREVAKVLSRPAWMMLDPEGPRGRGAGNLAWLAANPNDEYVQVGALSGHRPRSVVPRGSVRRASRLSTWRYIRSAPSPSGHATLSEVSPARKKIRFLRIRRVVGHRRRRREPGP